MNKRIFSFAFAITLCLGLIGVMPMTGLAANDSYSANGYTITRTPISGSTDYSYEAFDDAWGLYAGINLLRKDGTLIRMNIPSQSYSSSVYYSSVVDGRYKMIIIQNGQRKHGFLDENGNVAIDFIYESSYDFSEGLAPVKLDGKWGYINTSGTGVMPFEYDWALSFHNGMAAVQKDEKWGFVDKSGKVVIPIIYEDYGIFSEGLAPVKLNGIWGYVDKTGVAVIPFQFDGSYGAMPFSEGLAQTCKNGVTSFIDKTGKVVFSVSSNAGYQLSSNGYGFKDSRCLVTDITSPANHLRYGFIDTQGNLVVPMIYEGRVTSFNNGLAAVMKDGKYGIIDTLGNVIIPLEYEWATNFTDNYALVKGSQGQWYTLEIVIRK